MEINWKTPCTPSRSHADKIGFGTVGQGELAEGVPLNDRNLRFSPQEIARRILFFNTVARNIRRLSVRMSNVGT